MLLLRRYCLSYCQTENRKFEQIQLQVEKMKNIAFTALLLICSLFSFASHKSDLTFQRLKGKVKSVTESEYNADKSALMGKTVSNYNDSGNLAEFITFSPAGDMLSKATCTYDDSGSFVEEKRFKADGSLMVRTTRKYDEKGSIAEEYNYDAGGTL